MSFEEKVIVSGAIIWSKSFHFVVKNCDGQEIMLKAGAIEASTKSRLQVARIGCAECQFITEILKKRPIELSREDITNLNFSAILEVLPPMKKKRKKEPKKRR